MQTLTSLMNHLENNKDSQTLSLAYASVGDDGVGEVARFVRDNVFVKYLDLAETTSRPRVPWSLPTA